EDDLVRQRGPDEIAAGGVQHALGLSGGAGGVEDEERIFRAHLFGGALVGDGGGDVVIPDVAAVVHRHGRACAFHGEHGFHRRSVAEAVDGGVDIGFQRIDLAAAHAFIRRDDADRGAIVDASGETV